MVPDAVQIPNRSLFRQPEVCEIAQLQPYVLRSWEAEFPDLGVAVGHAFLGMVLPSNRFTRRYRMLDWDHAAAADVDWVDGDRRRRDRAHAHLTGALL